jgi:hypothetical protein
MRAFKYSSPAEGSNIIEYTWGLPENYKVPQQLLTCSVEELQELLTFLDGFTRREKEAFKRSAAADISADIERSVRTECERAVIAAKREAAAAAAEVATLKGMLNVYRAEGRAMEDDIRRRCDDAWTGRLLGAKEENDKMMAYMRSEMENVRGELKEAQERLYTRESALKVSQRRGRAGEDEFAAAALAAQGWTLERVSDQARACDFKMTYNGCCVRFEVKNHENAVPGEDVKKFRRDMEEHREDTGIGVFVALNAHLGGTFKGRLVTQEWKEDSGQLLLFISAFNEQDADFVFLLLKGVFDMYVRYKALRDGGTADEIASVTSELGGLRARIDNCMVHAGTMTKHLRELQLKVGRDKKTVMKMFDDTAEMLKSTSAEYQLMIEALLTDTVMVVEDEVKEESVKIKRKKN